jgi:hypothetical protein
LHNYFSDFDTLLQEASIIDDKINETTPRNLNILQDYSLTKWAIHHMLFQTIRIICLGFDLDLYYEQEYISMYWYLSQLSKMRYDQYINDRRRYKKEISNYRKYL